MIRGGIFRAIGELFVGLFHFIGDIFSAIFGFIGDVFRAIGDGIGWIVERVAKLFDLIGELFSSGKQANPEVQAILDSKDSDFALKGLPPSDLEAAMQAAMRINKTAKMDVFMSIPRDESEFTKIFTNEIPSDAALEEIKSVRLEVSKIALENESAVTKSVEGNSIEEFSQTLSNSESNYVAVVGHNENGAFKFPNGDSLSLAKLSAICSALKKSCIFLSCSSKKGVRGNQNIGLNFDLSYRDAEKILGKLSAGLARENDMTFEEIANLVARAELSVKLKPKVQALIVTTASGAALNGLIVGMEDERF